MESLTTCWEKSGKRDEAESVRSQMKTFVEQRFIYFTGVRWPLYMSQERLTNVWEKSGHMGKVQSLRSQMQEKSEPRWSLSTPFTLRIYESVTRMLELALNTGRSAQLQDGNGLQLATWSTTYLRTPHGVSFRTHESWFIWKPFAGSETDLPCSLCKSWAHKSDWVSVALSIQVRPREMFEMKSNDFDCQEE